MSSTLLANTMAPAIQLDAQPRRSMIGRVFAIRIFKSRPQLSATWIDNLIVMAKAVGNSGELASVPYVKVAANIVIQILEIIQLARQNRDDFRDLAQSLVNIIVTISETLQSYSDGREPPSTFTARCHAFLERISKLSVQINETVRDSQTWTRYFKGGEIRNMISQYRRELDELRANFTVTSVMQVALRIFAEQNPRQLGYSWECSKPIYFIDAMNIKTSLPMEFCHTRSDFEDLLKFMFRKRRGRRFVERADYALTNGDAEALNDHKTWHALVKPGITITMHIVLRLKTQNTANDSRRCPTCNYICTHTSLNDEVIWYVSVLTTTLADTSTPS
ncbi:hypothetical protein FPV67DRAFT_1131236 [Lyophyllum atratum]|nr:hypothetical protein FPV67DRAFT_1131236 [Lyophyllum atratum]